MAARVPRVVVTGMGCVSPLGCGVEATWAGAVEGCSGIGPITRFDAGEHPSQVAGEVPGEPDSSGGTDMSGNLYGER